MSCLFGIPVAELCAKALAQKGCGGANSSAPTAATTPPPSTAPTASPTGTGEFVDHIYTTLQGMQTELDQCLTLADGQAMFEPKAKAASSTQPSWSPTARPTVVP